jgi:hypothetical protein
MNTPSTRATVQFLAGNDHVSSDFTALASHMSDCQRSRGRLFKLHAELECLHALATQHLVTTGAVVVICSVALLALA